MNINELTGQLIPFNTDTAMKLAKEFYRGANGDPDKAKQLLKYFSQQVAANIDKHEKNVKMKRVTGTRL